MSELIIQAFTYGSGELRAEVALRPTIPEDIRGKPPQLQVWARALVDSMSTDLKHTDVWGCEICGKPARETQYDLATWTHLPQPRINLYVHHVCEAGYNVCSTILDKQSMQMAAMSGISPNIKKRDKPEGVEFPLSGSCLNCKKDDTAKAQLSRCGRCKLVRYCGSECQKADWQRHKKVNLQNNQERPICAWNLNSLTGISRQTAILGILQQISAHGSFDPKPKSLDKFTSFTQIENGRRSITVVGLRLQTSHVQYSNIKVNDDVDAYIIIVSSADPARLFVLDPQQKVDCTRKKTMSELLMEVFTYGYGDLRAEVVLRPRTIPEDIRGKPPQLQTWAESLVYMMGFDFKHTDVWDCEICGKPARETQYDLASWVHLPQPRIILSIHHVCEAGSNSCSMILNKQSEQLAAMSGSTANVIKRPKPEGMEFPLSGSCLNCQKDETSKVQLNRCGGCKLVRYCGSECQKADWRRHKKVCKMIESAQFVPTI